MPTNRVAQLFDDRDPPTNKQLVEGYISLFCQKQTQRFLEALGDDIAGILSSIGMTGMISVELPTPPTINIEPLPVPADEEE